jgi:Flp pilus assembly protein TadD
VSSNVRSAVVWIATACLAVLPFVGACRHGFVSDDHAQITRNMLVRSWDPVAVVARGSVTHGQVEWYRPLTIFTFAVNWALAGEKAFSYHVVNLALHAANTCLLLSIALALWGRVTAAMVAAALFGVHAVHVEAIVPVFGRADLLASLFVLGGWRISLSPRAAQGSRPIAVGACAFAGLLAKESAIALIPLLVASDLWRLVPSRGPWRDRLAIVWHARYRIYMAVLVAFVSYLAIRFVNVGGIWVEGSHVRYIENPLIETTMRTRVATAFWVVLCYLGLFLIPFPQRADYSYNQIPVIESVADPRLAVLVVVGLGTSLLLWRRPSRDAVLCVVAFAILFLPVSNVVMPIGTIMAERLLYLPSAALCLLAGWLFDAYARRIRRALQASVLAASTLVALHVIAAASHTAVWHSDETLFAATVEASPRSAKARVNYATVLLERGQSGPAEQMLADAVAIAPVYPEAHNLLGTQYLTRGDLAGAEKAFRTAVRDAPDYAPAIANLGIALRRLDRSAEATDLLRRAIALDPSLATAIVNLALLAEMRGDMAEAIALYSKAYDLDSSLEIARRRARELSAMTPR